jgi:hypothetical protein
MHTPRDQRTVLDGMILRSGTRLPVPPPKRNSESSEATDPMPVDEELRLISREVPTHERPHHLRTTSLPYLSTPEAAAARVGELEQAELAARAEIAKLTEEKD